MQEGGNRELKKRWFQKKHIKTCSLGEGFKKKKGGKRIWAGRGTSCVFVQLILLLGKRTVGMRLASTLREAKKAKEGNL